MQNKTNRIAVFAIILPVFSLSLTLSMGAGTPTPSAATKPAEVYSAFPFDAKEAARRQAETAAALGIPKDVSIDIGNKLMMKFVLVPAGEFVMGDQKRQVTLTKPYYISVYKVTQAQYQKIMGKNTSTYKGANFPIAAVSWDDATEFCAKVSEKTHRKVNLPTEAQWECMCRAGTNTAYFFGDDENKLPEYAWGVFNWGGTMHPVGVKKPNAFGIYDVHGLMWEWTRGYFSNLDPSKAVDPEDAASGSQHIARGGTYRTRPGFMKSSVRLAANVKPGDKQDGADRFGFRVEMDVE